MQHLARFAAGPGSAVVCFSLLTVLLTWPQVIRLADVPDHYDPLLSMWRLAWIAHQLPRDPRQLFDANIFWPERNTLAYSDATLLQGLLATPGLWVGVPTPVVYNLLVLASFVFAGSGAFALARSWAGSWIGALIAGVVFAFTAYRWDHYVHLELLWSGWMPLMLLVLHRAVQFARVRDGLAAGALLAAQTWSSIYYAVMFTAVLVVTTPLMAWATARASLRRVAMTLSAGALVTAVLVLPYLQPYRAAAAALGERSVGEAALFSAGPRHYLASAPGSVLYGGTAQWGRHEKRLFPGLMAVALAAIALWPPIGRKHLVLLAGLLVALDLSAGTGGVLFPMLREHVLPFRGLRAPARAAQIVLLFLGVLAACGWARVEGHLRSPRVRRFAAAGVVMVVLAESAQWPQRLSPIATEALPVYAWLGSAPPGAVVELPLPPDTQTQTLNPEYQFSSTFHWHPIVNGYSGTIPPSYSRTAAALQSFPSDQGIARLRGIGVRYLVMHEARWRQRSFRDVVLAMTRIPTLTLRARFGAPGAEVLVYEVLGAER